MKYVMWLVILVAILGGLLWLVAPDTPQPTNNGTPTTTPSTLQTYSNDTYGISFSYPDEYELSEREAGTAQRWHHVITLMRKEDLPPPEGGEGPPAITFDIYQNNLDKMSLNQWLTGTNASNFKLGNGTFSSTTVNGREAVSYSWSGLYEGRTVAFLHKDAVVAVSGTALMPTDPIYADFDAVVRSIQLR